MSPAVSPAVSVLCPGYEVISCKIVLIYPNICKNNLPCIYLLVHYINYIGGSIWVRVRVNPEHLTNLKLDFA